MSSLENQPTDSNSKPGRPHRGRLILLLGITSIGGVLVLIGSRYLMDDRFAGEVVQGIVRPLRGILFFVTLAAGPSGFLLGLWEMLAMNNRSADRSGAWPVGAGILLCVIGFLNLMAWGLSQMNLGGMR